MKHVAIVGGGIAGMAAAFALQERARAEGAEVRCTLLEAEPRLGGKIVTHRQDGFVLEGGPDSFITQKPWGLQLSRTLGLEPALIPCNEAKQAVYVVHRGRLVRMPAGFRLAAPTEWRPFLRSPLLTPWGKARVAMDLMLPPRREASDESIGDFLRRRFGREALEAMGGPLMAGIYVADPDRLSLQATFPMFAELERKHGSVIRGLTRARRAAAGKPPPPPLFMSFRDGMQTLVDRLRERLRAEVRAGVAVRRLDRAEHGYELRCDDGASLRADAVLLALPPHGAADLLAPLDAESARELHGIRSVSTAVLSLGYPASALPPGMPLDGFGFVAPKKEGRPVLACTWMSTKFDGRAPEGTVLFRLFVGGALQEPLAEQPEEDIVRTARDELASLMGVRGDPLVQCLTRWPRGNPQYDVGHLDRIDRIEAQLKGLPGIALAGGAYRGIGIPDCIHSAQRAVESLLPR